MRFPGRQPLAPIAVTSNDNVGAHDERQEQQGAGIGQERKRCRRARGIFHGAAVSQQSRQRNGEHDERTEPQLPHPEPGPEQEQQQPLDYPGENDRVVVEVQREDQRQEGYGQPRAHGHQLAVRLQPLPHQQREDDISRRHHESEDAGIVFVPILDHGRAAAEVQRGIGEQQQQVEPGDGPQREQRAPDREQEEQQREPAEHHQRGRELRPGIMLLRPAAQQGGGPEKSEAVQPLPVAEMGKQQEPEIEHEQVGRQRKQGVLARGQHQGREHTAKQAERRHRARVVAHRQPHRKQGHQHHEPESGRAFDQVVIAISSKSGKVQDGQPGASRGQPGPGEFPASPELAADEEQAAPEQADEHPRHRAQPVVLEGILEKEPDPDDNGQAADPGEAAAAELHLQRVRALRVRRQRRGRSSRGDLRRRRDSANRNRGHHRRFRARRREPGRRNC